MMNFLRITVGALVAATAGLVSPASASAFETVEHEPTTFLRLRSSVDAGAVRLRDGGVLQRRSVTQRADVAWLAPGVLGFVGASFMFDEGLPSRPSHPLRAERQLEPTLHGAWLRYSPGEGPLSLTLGRHDLTTGVTLARIDGVTARFAASGAHASLTFGVRPDPDILRIDDPTYAPWLDPADRDGFDDRTQLVEGSIGFDHPHVSASVWVRDEREVDRDTADGTRVASSLRVGAHDRPHATARVAAHAQLAAVERAEARAVVPIGDHTASIRGRHTRAIFPSRSLFSVFPQSVHQELVAAYDRRVSGSLLGARAIVRARSGDGEPAETLGGGGLELRLPSPERRSHLHASADGATGGGVGQRRSELRASLGGALSQRGGHWLHASQLLSVQWDERAEYLPVRQGWFSVVGARLSPSPWADITLSATAGWDSVNRASVRVFALADVSLPDTR